MVEVFVCDKRSILVLKISIFLSFIMLILGQQKLILLKIKWIFDYEILIKSDDFYSGNGLYNFCNAVINT
jgi:hypothetical protein